MIEAAYQKHDPKAGPIAWVALTSIDDPTRLVPKLCVDLVLGLPASDLDALSKALIPVDGHPWRVSRRSTIGLAVNPSLGAEVKGPSLVEPSLAGFVALDDPRRDAFSLAWAKSRLSARGYGEVVRSAANALRIGRGGSAQATVLRGEAAVAPATGVEGAIDDRSRLVKLEATPRWIEGVAIVAGARREDEARAFLAFLAERGQAEPVANADSLGAVSEADRLLADLLGASLVDAQDELWEVASALDRAGHPAELEAYLGDPPPWPPTSVAKLRALPDPQPLLETLAREISDDPESRSWLLDSWNLAPRKIDAAWLREAAEASGGRLVKEPKFRVWLRGEWTAWARQQYRRIGREAGKVTR